MTWKISSDYTRETRRHSDNGYSKRLQATCWVVCGTSTHPANSLHLVICFIVGLHFPQPRWVIVWDFMWLCGWGVLAKGRSFNIYRLRCCRIFKKLTSLNIFHPNCDSIELSKLTIVQYIFGFLTSPLARSDEEIQNPIIFSWDTPIEFCKGRANWRWLSIDEGMSSSMREL